MCFFIYFIIIYIAPDKDWRQLGIYPPLFGLIGYFEILNWVFQFFVLGIYLKANKQWNWGLFLLTFLFTFSFIFRKHKCNISLSEIAISNLFRKSNVSINSSLILRTTKAVLELVTIWYYSIALRRFRPRYAIVIVKWDECRNRVNIGY